MKKEEIIQKLNEALKSGKVISFTTKIPATKSSYIMVLAITDTGFIHSASHTKQFTKPEQSFDNIESVFVLNETAKASWKVEKYLQVVSESKTIKPTRDEVKISRRKSKILRLIEEVVENSKGFVKKESVFLKKIEELKKLV